MEMRQLLLWTEIRQLPWWESLFAMPAPSKKEWKKIAFVYYSLSELERRMSEYPITPELVEDFLNNYTAINLQVQQVDDAIIRPADALRYIIDIGRDAFDPETTHCLFHECIHGIYRIYTPTIVIHNHTYTFNEEIEKKIERTAKDFIAKTQSLLNI